MPSKYFYARFRSNLLKLFHVDTMYLNIRKQRNFTYSISRHRDEREHQSDGFSAGNSSKEESRSRMKSKEAEKRSGTQLEGARRWYQPTGEANFDVYIAHEQGGIQFYRFRIVRWNRSLVTRPVHTRAPPHEDKGASVPNCNLQIRVLFMIYKDAERG